MALTAGTRLGPYEVLAPLGAGGMGEVYRARDTRLSRTVAIKVLPADAASDAAARARFEREARAIATLSHPHICVVHDVGHQDGVDYLVMELLEGETLAQRIARAGGPLPLAEVLSIGAAIADALDRAHRAGIVHRDLKPLNVMLTKSGPKLLDFGLAKRHAGVGWSQAGETTATTAVGVPPGLPGSPARSAAPSTLAQERLTGEGTIVGSLHYMSPEQVEGHEADPRSDIWALGAVLYEMATGQRPFEGESPASVVGAILKDTPAPVSSRLPLSPPLFDRIVQKCLAKVPDARWQSASDLRDELEWIADARSSVTPPQATSNRMRTTTLGLAAALLLTVIFASLPWTHRGSPQVVPETRLEIATPATEEPDSFALSPGGLRLAFVASGDGPSRLWVRPLAATVAQPIAGTEGGLDPFWSPDGRSIGFFASGLLKRVDLDGGPPRTLATVSGARGGTWGAGDVIIFAPSQNSVLYRVPASGGEPAPVTAFSEGQQSQRWPSLLPDGRRFLFYVRGAAEATGIWLGDLDGREPTRLSAGDGAAVSSPAGSVFWVRGGDLVEQALDAEHAVLVGAARRVAEGVLADESNRGAVALARTGIIAYRTGGGGQRQLTWFGRTGAALGSVGKPDPSYRYVALSPDGAQVAVSRLSQGNIDLWLMDERRSNRFTFDSGADEFPVWEPDGKGLVFRSLRGGHYDLWRKLVAGGDAEAPLALSDEQKTPLSWSPDGRWLLYQNVTDPVTGADIFVMSMLDKRPRVVQKTQFTERNGAFSPDGRWVAYQSDESGRPEVYVKPFKPDNPGDSSQAPSQDKGQARWQVSTEGGVYPAWRRDGRELYFIDPSGAVTAVSVVAHDDSLAFGTPEALFSTRILSSGVEARQGRQYDVAADGRFLINTVVASAAPPITVVQNWNPITGK